MSGYQQGMFLALLAVAIDDPNLSASNYSVEAPMPERTGALVWSDEFDGPALDMSKWSFDTSRNKEGWYNKELQYYAAGRPENLRIEDGILVIEARKDPEAIRDLADYGGQQYSSAKIHTTGKAAFRHGFIEARAKLPCTGGTWPAIWMLPEGGSNWPDAGEIDILEHVGSQPNVVHGTLHTGLFNHARGTQRGAQISLPTACSHFHNYQLHWTPDTITVGVDGRAFMRIRNDQPGGHGAWPFDKPFYLILNLAMGGDWAGAPDDAALPQRFEVDYIRVWDAGPAGEQAGSGN